MSYDVNQTKTGRYSIYKKDKLVSSGLKYEKANISWVKETLDKFTGKESGVIDYLNEEYNKQFESDEEKTLDFDVNKEDNKAEVISRMRNYLDNYDVLRFDDDLNIQFDLDKAWLKENDPKNSILKEGYKELDTRRRKVKHLVSMSGLSKVFSFEDIYNWMKSLKQEHGTSGFHLGFKYDGAAAYFRYDNTGNLVEVATRGNGFEGDDIKDNGLNFKNTKSKLNLDKRILEQVDFIEVRGEVICTKTNFKNQEEIGIKNTRQFAAGSMKLKDSEEVKKRGLAFVPYTIVFIKNGRKVHIETEETIFNSQRHLNTLLNSLGFKTNFGDRLENQDDLDRYIAFDNNLEKFKEELKEMIDEQYQKRNILNLDIDGLVFKVNDYKEQIEVGEDYALAYKFPSEASLTKIESIDFQVGRTGRVTPVVNYSPIDILGVTCSRATIHNSDYFEDYKLSIGDTVSVTRNGDVIPQISEIVVRSGKSPISFIETCPSCGSKLIREGAFHYCKNQECPVKNDGAIYSFVSALGVNFIGGSKIEAMIEDGTLKSPFDFLDITKETLLKYEGMGETSANKIIASLEEQKKNLKFSTLLHGLSITGLGGTNAEKIALAFSNLISHYFGEETTKTRAVNLKEIGQDILLEFVTSTLETIDGVGPVLIDKIREKDIFKQLSEVIDKHLVKYDFLEKVNGNLSGKTFYITGKLSMSRGDFVDNFIYNNGGEEEKLKKADFVIAGLNPTDWKIEEAKTLGKTILKEEEFFKKFNLS